MLSTLRTRLNKARRLQPILCLKGINGSVYGMRSATDQSVNYQVRVVSSRSISVASNKEKIAHSIYTCTCQQVSSPDMHACKGSEHTVCYHSLASVRKMAQDAGKKVVFCRDMRNALLKRKIYKGALIEVKSGARSVYGSSLLMFTFILISTILYLFLAIIWKHGDWTNAILKLVFYLLAGYGFYLVLISLILRS